MDPAGSDLCDIAAAAVSFYAVYSLWARGCVVDAGGWRKAGSRGEAGGSRKQGRGPEESLLGLPALAPWGAWDMLQPVY